MLYVIIGLLIYIIWKLNSLENYLEKPTHIIEEPYEHFLRDIAYTKKVLSELNKKSSLPPSSIQ